MGGLMVMLLIPLGSGGICLGLGCGGGWRCLGMGGRRTGACVGNITPVNGPALLTLGIGVGMAAAAAIGLVLVRLTAGCIGAPNVIGGCTPWSVICPGAISGCWATDTVVVLDWSAGIEFPRETMPEAPALRAQMLGWMTKTAH